MLKLDFNKPGKTKTVAYNQGVEDNPQESIEQVMRHAVQLGHYEVVCLFTEDGLPLAEVGAKDDIGRDLMAEVAVHLQKVRETICQLDYFVGLNEIVFETGTLQLLSPTDCVKDRLTAYYHWDDLQALEQAKMVAKNHKIDFEEIRRWSAVEK